MRQNGLEVRATRRSRDWVWGLALGVLFLSGCGAEAYEKRLSNTRLLFAHMELVNQNLQGTWSDPETGVSLRAPLQFVVLPPPVKAEPDPAAQKGKAAEGEAMDEEEEGEEEILDDRQPDYVNLGLPGLRGAFRAPVKMVAEKNANTAGEAFLYVLTNHDLAEKPEEAKEFEQEFIKTLTETLHVAVDVDKDWREEKFPPGDPATNGFVRPVKYRNVTVTPTEDIAGYTRQFSVYMYQQGDIQVVVLFVLPADTDASENFTKRVPLCLETLGVTGDKLIRPMKGGPPAGAGSTSAF
jgi:hypothetical protein